MKLLTLSTCFYKIKSKFDEITYKKWIDNFLSNVNNFNLVVYTNKESLYLVKKYSNKNIKIIIKEFNSFYNYKYKKFWKLNNKNNKLLGHLNWKLQMIWAEKISFVKNTIEKQYFKSKWYGWCDIGYFRNRINDLNKLQLKNWPNNKIIKLLNPNKIYYGQICNNLFLEELEKIINNKNEFNLPINQVSVAGGFFLITSNNINYWHKLFDNKLQTYFNNNRLVKDDQIILINCILLNKKKFKLIKENDKKYDKWFLFQRYLLNVYECKYCNYISINKNIFNHHIDLHKPVSSLNFIKKKEIKKLVSVIITTYNRFEYFVKALNSVKNQTYKNKEIIVINDCSNDKQYYNYNYGSNVKVIHCKKNSKEIFGFACPGGYQRNLGIEIAKGEYIAFLDDDDCWLPNKLDEQIKFMIKNNCKICSTDAYYGNGLYNNKKKYNRYLKDLCYNNNNKYYLKKKIWNLKTILFSNFIICSSVVIKRSLINKIGKFIVYRTDEDYDYWKKALKYVNNYYIDKPLIYYDMGHGGGKLY